MNQRYKKKKVYLPVGLFFTFQCPSYNACYSRKLFLSTRAETCPQPLGSMVLGSSFNLSLDHMGLGGGVRAPFMAWQGVTYIEPGSGQGWVTPVTCQPPQLLCRPLRPLIGLQLWSIEAHTPPLQCLRGGDKTG